MMFQESIQNRPFAPKSVVGEVRKMLLQQPLRHFGRHEHIFHESDRERNIYLIGLGLAKLYTLLGDGRQQVISFRFAGDVIGSDMAVVQDCSAAAITDLGVHSLSYKAVQWHVTRHSQLASNLIELMSEELATTRSQITVLNGRTATEKVSGFILDMSRHSAHSDRVAFEPSRTDIADFLGLTIETVCRQLTKLRVGHVIDLPETRFLTILNRQRLEELAAGKD